MYMDNWRLKPAHTEPVILLRPEDMHARVNHQLTMRSHIDLEIHSYNK